MLLKICQCEWLIQHLLCSNNYSDKITGKSKNPFTIRVIDDVFILYSFYSFVESISKLDVISIILKNSDKSCRFQEIYPKLQAHLTMSQLMKFIFELKKYDLLISLGDESNYIITPKGMQYLQIHEELTSQIYSGNIRNFGTFNSYSWLE